MFLQNKSTLLFLFCIFAFASTGIYVFERGYPQPGHFLLLAFMFPLLLHLRSATFELPEKLLLAFVCYVLVINTYFYVSVGGTDFIVASLYWAYNTLIFLSLRQLFLTRPELGQALAYAFIILLVLSVGVALFGGGNFYWQGRRLMGTFNDPNQMSYWLLCALVGLFVLKDRPGWFTPYVGLVLAILVFLLVMLAGSRSAMIATLVLIAANLWWLTEKLRADQHLHLSRAGGGAYLLLVIALLILLLAVLYQFHPAVRVAGDDLLRRLFHTDYVRQLEIRGYTRLYDFPQYLLFGAGEGQDGRFTPKLFEIHSSWVAPLFYYGVIGFGLIYGFFYQLIKGRMRGWQLLAITAPFVYGIFTYGLRTPIFWIMLAIVYTRLRTDGMEK